MILRMPRNPPPFPRMAHNQAHNELVRVTLLELAKAGYCAWKNETGVWFEHDERAEDEKGRPHKYGKVGSADIFCILPLIIGNSKFGLHCEFEAKTGTGRQNPNQKKHQEYVVERNGGFYMVFRDTDALLTEVRAFHAFKQHRLMELCASGL